MSICFSGGSGSTIQGFVINRFQDDNSGNGGGGFILENSSNNTIAGNFIGVNSLGTAASSNGGSGIFGLDASANNTIGGSNPQDRSPHLGRFRLCGHHGYRRS